MVMADRPEVATASTPVAAVTMVGLAENMVNALARVPFRHPWQGPSGVVQNLGTNVTRQVIRSFMGYSTGLPIEEFRSMEQLLDEVCKVVLPPWVSVRDATDIVSGEINGVPGIRARSRSRQVDGTVLYLHGGGYIGTSPTMYAAFVGALVKGTGCEAFVADYRLAPEFPYPAGLHDAVDVYRGLLDAGVDPASMIVAGDSGGGGLATSLMGELFERGLPRPAGLVLFSPEVDLDLDHESVTTNAGRDILPWNIPVTSYLHGVQPSDAHVSAVYADAAWFPPTFVTLGGDEMFRDGIREFAERLARSGVDVEMLEEPGMFHVFPILMPWSGPARRVFDAVELFVARHVRPTDTDASSAAVTAT
jgi:monoterpene epsilon-lactone hydrolase